MSARTNLNFRVIAALFIATLINACGGSGGSSSTPTPTPIPADNIAPVITLNGKASLNQWLEMPYVEKGATARDNLDGEVEVVISGEVDPAKASRYIISYTATDKANNVSTLRRVIDVLPLRPFKTTWSNNLSCGSGSGKVQISTVGSGYNYTIDWGDGHVDENVTGDIIHDYSNTEGNEVLLKISGDFPQIHFPEINSGNPDSPAEGCKLNSIEQWGDIKWRSMASAFSGVTSININATDNPNLSQVTSLANMFSHVRTLNGDLSQWDVSNVSDMRGMFEGAWRFNSDISRWDVSNVTNMSNMFKVAVNFNSDISQWDVSNVTNMNSMFYQARFFEGDISQWNVSSVKDMSHMFYDVFHFSGSTLR